MIFVYEACIQISWMSIIKMQYYFNRMSNDGFEQKELTLSSLSDQKYPHKILTSLL